MQAGKLIEVGVLRYRLARTFSRTGDGSASASCRLTQKLALDPNNTTELITLAITDSDATPGLGAITIQGLYSDYFSGVGSLTVEFHDVRAYLTNQNRFKVYVSEIRIFAGGTQRGLIQNVMFFNDYIAPAGLPLFSPTFIDGVLNSNAGQIIPPPGCIPFSETKSGSSSLTVTGGYSADGAFPMQVEVLMPNTPSCDVPTLLLPSLSATDTDSLRIELTAHNLKSFTREGPYYCYKCCDTSVTEPVEFMREITIEESHDQNAMLVIAPAVAQEWIALTQDSAELVRRYSIPSAKLKAQAFAQRIERECAEVSECSDSTNREQEVFTEQPADTIILTNESIPLLPSPYTANTNYFYFMGRNFRACSPGPCASIDLEDPWNCQSCVECFQMYELTKGAVYTSGYPTLSDPVGMHPYLRHAENLMRYWNTVYHQHWNRFLVFEDWPKGNPLSPRPRAQYWIPNRTQYFAEPLPESNRTYKRNLVCLEPLTETAFVSFLLNEYAQPHTTWWAGVPRFHVPAPAPLAELVLDSNSQPRWTVSNATVMFGSQIAITPMPTTQTLTFDLINDEYPPYLYPALANKVKVDFDPSRVRVYAENINGERKKLTPDADRWYRIEQFSDTNYQGSWVIAMDTDESGTDLRSEGQSAQMATDRERRAFMAMLNPKLPAKLVLEFEETMPFLLPYPRFAWDLDTYNTLPLTGNTYAVLRPNNGYQYFPYNPFTRQVREPQDPTNVADYLAIRRWLYRAEEVSDALIAADGEMFYDTVEFLPPTFAPQFRRQDLQSDTRTVPLTNRYMAQQKYLLVNAYSAIPPLSMFPSRRRKLDTLEYDTDSSWGNYSYLLAPTNRYYINPNTPAQLFKVSYDSANNEVGRTQFTAYESSHGIWRISTHNQPVQNNEVMTNSLLRFYVNLRNTDYARVVPFWGYWLSIPVAEKQIPVDADSLTVDTLRGWVHVAVEGSLRSYYQYEFVQFVLTSLTERIVAMTTDTRAAALYLLSKSESQHRVLRSFDAGKTFEEVFMFNATQATITALSRLGKLLLIYHDGTNVYSRYFEAGTWTAPQQVLLDGAPMVGLPVDAAYDDRANAVVMLYKTATDFAVAVSHDYAQSFTTVL